MKTFLKKSKGFVFGFSFFSMGLVPAYADDTEIYFGGDFIGANVATRPNILFVLDTSGSMSFSLSGSNNGSNERLNALKESMTSLLSTMSNVNVGIMRFTNPGGPVLHEVAYIDDVRGSGNVTVTSQVSNSQSDATELLVGGAVTLNDPSLEFVDKYTGLNSISVTANSDGDVSTEALNSDRTGNTWNSGCPQLIDRYYNCDSASGSLYETLLGVRFRNLGIPNSALISSATVTFGIDDQQNGGSGENDDDLSVEIRAEAVDSGVFSYANNSYDLSSRTLTTNSVIWDINSNPSAGQQITTDDVSTLIKELVDDGAWNTSSSATLIFSEALGSDGGRRELERHSDSLRPQLDISYANSVDPQRVGVRFSSVGIPSGATITNAYIDFTAESSNSDAATYTISAENVGNSPEFQNITSNIGSRTRTTNQVTWSNVEAWTGGSVYSTPDLKDMVQEVVNHADWCGGNAMSFIVEGSSTGRRVAESYDGAPGAAPRLIVEYDALNIPASGGCMAEERSYRVAAGSDDAEQSGSSGNGSIGGSQLNLRSDRKFVGVRFNGLAIPKDADITSAHLEFRAAESDSGSLTVNIAAQDIDNAPTFDGGSSDISSRVVTSASTTWTPGNWSQNQFYQTADISDSLEEVVGRSGWSIGNSVAFIIEYQSGSGGRDAVSHNSQAANAPRLVVSYSTDNYQADLVTVRDDLQAIIEHEIIASGSTPIVETYHEAALYMRGDPVKYGKNRSPSSSYDNITRVSTSNSWTGGTLNRAAGCTDDNLNSDACASEYISGSAVYTSPMEYSCQENHIVFLTDGEPTSGNDSISDIKSLIGGNCADYSDNDYECGEELAKFLFEEDQVEGIGALAGTQSIKTHTIALIGGQSNWLESIANNGGGDYYPISGSSVPVVVSNLTAAFNSIVGDVLDVDTSFVAPAVAINQFNRLTHRSEIYYAVFKPQESPEWPGNLKKYKLSGADVEIVDANNQPAVDLDTGGFKTTSKSVWSDVTDGNDVTLGGAANELPSYTTRKVYIHHSNSSSTNLTVSDNLLQSSNSEIDVDMLGIPGASSSYRTNLIDWIRGKDVNDDDGDTDVTESRNVIGDPLHSRPLVVTYDADPNDDGDGADSEYYLFFGTNGGLIHAVDGRTGQEKYAIAIEELMPNFDVFFRNQEGVTRPYGVDGESTVWVQDVDRDGKIEPGDGDHVYLYIGMRRGGRSYYAFDITNINSPKFMWRVEGGAGDFAELGQSWSKPLLTKVRYDNAGSTTTKQVLFFGGGYDDNQDDVSTRTPDSMGRAVYMVDAETGALLWKAEKGATGNAESVNEMLYGIPTRLAGADIDNDGLLDMLFYGDMGGQVFRTDFDNSGDKSLAAFSSTKRIANLAKDGAEADNRRFYHGADIALTRVDGQKFLTILIGSGYRAHPLERDNIDRFYAIKQLLDGSSTYVDLTEDDFYDATDNDAQDGSSAQQAAAKAAITSAKGWYITMENTGEKILSRPLVVEGAVVFTTYEPKASLVGCTPVPGQSREYIVSVLDATAVVDKDDVDGLSKSDRSSLLNLQGIVDDTVLVKTEDGQGGFQGTQKSGLDLGGDSAVRTFWYQETN